MPICHDAMLARVYTWDRKWSESLQATVTSPKAYDDILIVINSLSRMDTLLLENHGYYVVSIFKVNA